MFGVGLVDCGDETPAETHDATTADARDAGADTDIPDVDFDFGSVDTRVDLGPDVEVDVVEPDACEALRTATAVRARSLPGARQLLVQLSDEEGAPLPASFASCLTVADEIGGELPSAWSETDAGPGATLLVARWHSDEVAATRAFIDAFVARRPAEERIAVWAWSDTLLQVVGATTDRARLEQRLDRVFTADDAEPLAVELAAHDAAEGWEQISQDTLRGTRAVVFVAPGLELEARPDLDRDYVIDFWAVEQADIDRAYAFTGDGDAEATAEAISGALDARQEAGLGVLAFCDAGQEIRVELQAGDRTVRRVGLGRPAPEHAEQPCDLTGAIAGPSTDDRAIEITFTPEERAIFDRIADDRDRDTRFTGGLRIVPFSSPAPFAASFRGQTSIRCARKSLSVDLDDGDDRDILPESGTDEFYLVSMCKDDRYVNQLTADRLMQQLGVWHVELGTVSVRIDDVSQGFYLYTEVPDEEVRRDISRVRAVIRRRNDANREPADPRWAHDDLAAAGVRYGDFLEAMRDLSGAELVDALDGAMDLDQYLRWVALMTLLGNGDYIDEVYFVAEESVDRAHRVIDYYTIHGWDPDDIFSDCHHGGANAFRDPNGLLYCTESVLDHLVVGDPAGYARYVDALRAVMESVDVEVFSAEVERTHDEIAAWLEDGEIRAAMVELLEANPEAIELEVAAAEIRTASDALRGAFVARYAELEAGLATLE